MEQKYLTVSALNRYLKAKLDADTHLKRIFLQGEISNFKSHHSGHLYFTIKDDKSRINAVMFSSYAKKLKIKLQDGLKVLIVGSLSVYETAGDFQLYVYNVELDGMGQLYLEFEQLKKKLYLEGIFDASHKKNLPLYPKTIGLICANPSAAMHDVLKTINLRYPIAKIVLFPTLVQGNKAYLDIIDKIKIADKQNLDVLIIARGGGSIEELWNFNHEELVRAVYNANTPIISGVGHESDTTLIDYVADRRAPTPTGAAILAVPDKIEVLESIKTTVSYMQTLINYQLVNKKQCVKQLSEHHLFKNPKYLFRDYNLKLEQNNLKLNQMMISRINNYKNQYDLNNQNLIYLKNKFTDGINYKIQNYESTLKKLALDQFNQKQNNFQNLINQLDLVSPLNILKRGYSLVTFENHLISDSSQVKIGDNLNIRLKTGELKVEVKEKNNG